VVGAGVDLPTFEAASPLCRDLAAERGDSGCLADGDEPLGEVEEAVAIGCRGNLVNAGPLGEDWVKTGPPVSRRFPCAFSTRRFIGWQFRGK
jgi:hypothetical protein